MTGPRAGVHYPRSMGEFGAWFGIDADCLDYLEWLRWPPGGFCCSSCGHDQGWRLGDRRFECTGCRTRTSTTAGTIFDRTRTPLTVWFTACWALAGDKGRNLGTGPASQPWRSARIRRRGRCCTGCARCWSVLTAKRLAGVVEVDETYIGGHEPGLSGGPARGKKVLTVIAVESGSRGAG